MKGTRFTFTQLRYFNAACETLSTARAAELLGVSQSGISTAISHLERVTGETLFLRIPAKGLRLTAEGQELRRIAGDMLSRADEIAHFGMNSQRELVGTVRIACYSTLVPYVLPPLLEKVERRYPKLRVEMVETNYSATIGRLRSADVSLGVLYDAGIPADLHTEHIAVCRPYVLVGERHRLADHDAVDLSELDGERLVTIDIETSREFAHRILRKAGAQVRESSATSNIEALRAIVASSDCFAVLNQHPGHDLANGGMIVRSIPIRGEVEIPRIALISRDSASLSARTTAVQNLLSEVGAAITRRQLHP